MSRFPAKHVLAVAAGAAAAFGFALRTRGERTPDPLDGLAGAWAGVASGPGARRVEVALAIARRPARGLVGRPGFELALRTLEDVGGKPLERSSTGLLRLESRVRAALGDPGRTAERLVFGAPDVSGLRLELDGARVGELRLLAARYWRAPAHDLSVVLARAPEPAA